MNRCIVHLQTNVFHNPGALRFTSVTPISLHALVGGVFCCLIFCFHSNITTKPCRKRCVLKQTKIWDKDDDKHDVVYSFTNNKSKIPWSYERQERVMDGVRDGYRPFASKNRTKALWKGSRDAFSLQPVCLGSMERSRTE